MRRRSILGALWGVPALADSGGDDLSRLPANLPVPLDDGTCDHLPGLHLPAVPLSSTRGGKIVLPNVHARRVIVYAYPRTGAPGKDLPPGWNDIPGARGCTPQNCSMRDHHCDLRALGAEVFGLSTQTTAYQHEMAARLQLPFALLSDAGLQLTKALRLPTFEIGGMTLLKRFTIVARGGVIEKVFYPVFPPDQHGQQVVAWLRHKRQHGA